jgi:hypothetical protein
MLLVIVGSCIPWILAIKPKTDIETRAVNSVEKFISQKLNYTDVSITREKIFLSIGLLENSLHNLIDLKKLTDIEKISFSNNLVDVIKQKILKNANMISRIIINFNTSTFDTWVFTFESDISNSLLIVIKNRFINEAYYDLFSFTLNSKT